jgi:hypothetical protein
MTDNNEIDYAKLIDDAMHYAVRKVLQGVAENGLPGDHHFFITFRTSAPGVMISDVLRKKYPEEMTIVIQHQFFDLEVDEKQFSIVLSFDHVKHNLTIPFDSLTSFVDPSVRFGLQFNFNIFENDGENEDKKEVLKDADGKILSNVVTLDSFRKKNGNKE